MVNRYHISLWALLLLFLFTGTAAAVSVQAVADRDRIAPGESLQLQLRVDGSPDGDPDLTALAQDWDILSRSQSSQMQIVNGSYSRSLVYSLALLPKKQGTVMIPAICFAKDCSLPLPIDVSANAAKSGGREESLLLETEISPAKVILQGQLVFKVRLLRRVDLLQGKLNEPQPTGVAAVVKKLGDDRSYETRRDGLLFQVIERDYAVYPQESGTLTIPSLQFDGSVAVGRSQYDPFGQRGRRVRRTSKPVKVEVSPAPTDLGSRPWIPAIALHLEDDWQNKLPKFTVGEPVTRTLRLVAKGVQSAQLPELKIPAPSGFKSYPDQAKKEDHASEHGITGILEQKIAFVPMNPGHYRLPPIDLDWWDIRQDRWQKAHLDGLDIEVSAVTEAGATPQQKGNAKPPKLESETEPSTPGLPVPAPAAGLTQTDKSPVAGFWPWLSLGLGCGWLLTLVILIRDRRRSLGKQQAEPDDAEMNIKQARKSVIEAARANDPQATRQALVAWSRQIWPGRNINAFDLLRQHADPGLLKELERLDTCLYGPLIETWFGQGLVDEIRDWNPQQKNDKPSVLPDLYP